MSPYSIWEVDTVTHCSCNRWQYINFETESASQDRPFISGPAFSVPPRIFFFRCYLFANAPNTKVYSSMRKSKKKKKKACCCSDFIFDQFCWTICICRGDQTSSITWIVSDQMYGYYLGTAEDMGRYNSKPTGLTAALRFHQPVPGFYEECLSCSLLSNYQKTSKKKKKSTDRD